MAGSPGTVVLGYQSVVKINGTAFGVRSGRLRYAVDEHETGDTNTGVSKIHQGGRQWMEVSCEFFEKSLIQTLIAPLSIIPGTYISIQIYPFGLLDSSNNALTPYQSDYFLVAESVVNFDVDGKVQGSFSGKSSGGIGLPSNA